MMKDEDSESSSSDPAAAAAAEASSEPLQRLPAVIRNGKSCTGCLYHSSDRVGSGRNPLCVGISRSHKQVYVSDHPQYDQLNDGKALLAFKYACLGYSVYKTRSSAASQERVDLPACLGIEMQLLEPEKAHQAHHPAVPGPVSGQITEQTNHTHEEDSPASTRPVKRPPTVKSDEFATRFFRTAGLIAGAVGNNLSRVAGSLKTGLDDIFYPDRRRPK